METDEGPGQGGSGRTSKSHGGKDAFQKFDAMEQLLNRIGKEQNVNKQPAPKNKKPGKLEAKGNRMAAEMERL